MYCKKSLLVLSIIFLFSASSCREKAEKSDPLSSLFAPQVQTFYINPAQKNTLTGKRGTRIGIPEKAFDLDYARFKGDEKVTFQLVEIVDNFDFATSGVDLSYNLDGQNVPFESAGMFKMDAEFEGAKVKLKKDNKIDVQFPDITPGEKFNVYKMDNKGTWQYNGHNQETGSFGDEGIVFNESRPKIFTKTVFVRHYLVDELTWWNFDYPHNSYACLKGLVAVPDNKYFYVYVIGVSKKGYTSRLFKGGNFSVNAYLNTDVKIVVITEDDEIGFTKTIKTGDRYGDRSKPEGPHNYYQNIGEIKLKKMNEKIKTDRREILKLLDMKEEKYTVKYKS